MTAQLNRRHFLTSTGTSAAGIWIAANYPAMTAAASAHAEQLAAGTLPESFVTLAAPAAATIDAITARIVPTEGEGPGAREARVVHFIDQGLAEHLAGAKESIESGLMDFNVSLSTIRNDGVPFADLSIVEQDAFLKTQEDSSFFELLQFFTCIGMFALPGYGGNAEKQGWQLIGFEDRHAFAPPFGYYDRNYPGYEAVAASHQQPGDAE